MEIRFPVNDDTIDRIKIRTQMDKATDVGREAIALLDWATAETAAGRRIVSTDASGNHVHVPISPALNPDTYSRF